MRIIRVRLNFNHKQLQLHRHQLHLRRPHPQLMFELAQMSKRQAVAAIKVLY